MAKTQEPFPAFIIQAAELLYPSFVSVNSGVENTAIHSPSRNFLFPFVKAIYSNVNTNYVFYNFMYIGRWFNPPTESLSRMNRKVQGIYPA
jgi:hypothetical protein